MFWPEEVLSATHSRECEIQEKHYFEEMGEEGCGSCLYTHAGRLYVYILLLLSLTD